MTIIYGKNIRNRKSLMPSSDLIKEKPRGQPLLFRKTTPVLSLNQKDKSRTRKKRKIRTRTCGVWVCSGLRSEIYINVIRRRADPLTKPPATDATWINWTAPTAVFPSRNIIDYMDSSSSSSSSLFYLWTYTWTAVAAAWLRNHAEEVSPGVGLRIIGQR